MQHPSFKILVPIVSAYTLCLFLPTIDTLAIYTLNLYYFSIPLGVSTLIFPVIYPLADSITEVYGKKISFYIVISSYISIIIFSFMNDLLLFMADNSELYLFLLRSSVLLTIVGPIGYFFAMYVNIRLISKLKIIMRGKHFIVRSFICSGISDVIISLIVQPVLFHDKGSDYIIKTLLGTILAKIIITIPLVFFAKGLVILCRYVDGIDRDLYNKNWLINITTNGTIS